MYLFIYLLIINTYLFIKKILFNLETEDVVEALFEIVDNESDDDEDMNMSDEDDNL